MQVKSGQVILTNASATVKGVNFAMLDRIRYTATYSGLTGTPSAGETFVGQTTGATLQYESHGGGTVTYRRLTGTPGNGEVFLGQTSGATWTLTLHTIVNFSIGETLSFTPSGAVGRVVRWINLTGELRYERVTGTPAANDTVTGGTSAGRGRAVSPLSTTKWLTGQNGESAVSTGGVYASIFCRRGIATNYEVLSVSAEDLLTLSVNYVGASEDDTSYRISQDFDSDTGLILLNNGDVDVPSLWNRNISRIKTLLGNAIGLFTSPPSFAGNARRSTRVNAGETALELFLPVVAAETNTFSALQSFNYGLMRLLKDTIDTGEGGLMKLEAGSLYGTPDLVLAYSDRMLKLYVDTVPAGTFNLQWNPYTGRLTIDELSITKGFTSDLAVTVRSTFKDSHEDAYRGFQITLTGLTGSFTNGEVVDFGTSGAVARVQNVVGATLIVNLLNGPTPQTGETITGRTSAATATVNTPVDAPLSGTTATTATYGTSPAWVTDEWRDLEVEVVTDPTTPTAVGQVHIITSNNTTGQLTVGGWTVQPSVNATLRIRDPLEMRDLEPRPYGIAKPLKKTGGDQTPITTETAITGLAPTTAIPGADGNRWYHIRAHLSVENNTTTAANVKARIRVGSAGTTADALQRLVEKLVSATTAASPREIIELNTYVQLKPNDRITVSLESTQSIRAHGNTTAGLRCELDVMEVKRRT